ncbi:HAD family hydrolase [Reichenbachiella ulvae]|uniref:HAD family phosphatase n=1 Tax=Reichenbachiella ulvae TaxID=2980104 RepID=A0ABT3CQJ1_9BACT|nr:HAD family phosphatase [Reichenbachiella ulvae]MCV9385892.1 HAD family phosphatase [Reichenbachiella ulvae]
MFQSVSSVIFDMDGVIIDSEPISQKVVHEMAMARGVDLPDQIHRDYVGAKTSTKWAFIVESYGWKDDVMRLTAESDDRYLELIKTSELNPIDGVLELMEAIYQMNKKMIVASSASRYNIRLVLDKFGLSNYFDQFVSSEDVKHAKPNPDIFLKAAQQLKSRPDECLVIEDSKNGVLAAKSAGMQVIGYQNHRSGNQDLEAADHVVNHLDEVIALIQD